MILAARDCCSLATAGRQRTIVFLLLGIILLCAAILPPEPNRNQGGLNRSVSVGKIDALRSIGALAAQELGNDAVACASDKCSVPRIRKHYQVADCRNCNLN